MASIELAFSAVPSHVRTARIVAVAMARRAGVDDDALDEVRLAVGEACSRAVGLHLRRCPQEPVTVVLSDDDARFAVTVTDRVADDADNPDNADDLSPEGPDNPVAGAAEDPESELLPPGVGLAVIRGLVDDVEVESGPAGGAVRMTWPASPPAPVPASAPTPASA